MREVTISIKTIKLADRSPPLASRERLAGPSAETCAQRERFGSVLPSDRQGPGALRTYLQSSRH